MDTASLKKTARAVRAVASVDEMIGQAVKAVEGIDEMKPFRTPKKPAPPDAIAKRVLGLDIDKRNAVLKFLAELECS
jgi:hypothetical protein